MIRYNDEKQKSEKSIILEGVNIMRTSAVQNNQTFTGVSASGAFKKAYPEIAQALKKEKAFSNLHARFDKCNDSVWLEGRSKPGFFGLFSGALNNGLPVSLKSGEEVNAKNLIKLVKETFGI